MNDIPLPHRVGQREDHPVAPYQVLRDGNELSEVTKPGAEFISEEDRRHRLQQRQFQCGIIR